MDNGGSKKKLLIKWHATVKQVPQTSRRFDTSTGGVALETRLAPWADSLPSLSSVLDGKARSGWWASRATALCDTLARCSLLLGAKKRYADNYKLCRKETRRCSLLCRAYKSNMRTDYGLEEELREEVRYRDVTHYPLIDFKIAFPFPNGNTIKVYLIWKYYTMRLFYMKYHFKWLFI